MDRLTPVYIKWVDTISDSDDFWKNTDQTNDFFERQDNIVHEVGFIWSEDEEFICLISKYFPSEDEEVTLTCGRTKIPKKWILERKDFKTNSDKQHKNKKKK